METGRLRDILVEILTGSQPSIDILQNLTKSELDEVEEAVIGFGYLAVNDILEKAFRYKIPGVGHSGFIPEDHPERQMVVDHINKLMTLPDDHPKKGVARNVARLLQERHLKAPSVVDDGVVKPAAAAAPKAEAITRSPSGETTINYAEMNKPKFAGVENTLDYKAMNAPKVRPEADKILDYSSGSPQWKPNVKPETKPE